MPDPVLAHAAVGWHVQPVPVLLAGLALALFAQGFVRLRRRAPAHARAYRAVLFVLAVAVATLPLVSPLDGYADDYLLSAHMLEHVLIADVAPALALVAVRGPLVFFLLPSRTLRALARVQPLRRFLAFLLRPLVAFVLWVAVTAAWHVPAAYDYAAEHGAAHDLEHAAFLLAGVLVWAQLVDPARRHALSDVGRILYAWGLFAASHLTTHLILFDSVPHYRHYAEQPDRVLGLSPLADQHWAAWVMTVDQLVLYGALTLAVVATMPLRDVSAETGEPV